MPQQPDSIVSTSRPGTSLSVFSTSGIAANAFWWQWPWSKAFFCGSGFKSSFSRPAACSRARNSSNRNAFIASRPASAPGSMDRNSSRSPSRQEGSSPTTGTPRST